QIAPDLRLPREAVRPAGLGREGERVEMRLDVAGAAGIGVVAPRAADVAGALEDDEVVDAVALQADGGAQTAEAAADDRDMGLAGRRRGRVHGSKGWPVTTACHAFATVSVGSQAVRSVCAGASAAGWNVRAFRSATYPDFGSTGVIADPLTRSFSTSA